MKIVTYVKWKTWPKRKANFKKVNLGIETQKVKKKERLILTKFS